MNRKEIKSLAKAKLKGRWLNIVLLTLIIAIVEGVASSLIGETDGMVYTLLNLANNFLLVPAITASGIVYTIKFVREKEKVSLKEAIPSGKTFGRFIANMIIFSIFEIPVLIFIFVGELILVLVSTSLYTSMLMGEVSMDPMITIWAVAFLIIVIALIFFLLIGILLFPMPYLMAEEDCGIFDAVKRSFKIMKGHKGELFVLGLSFLGWLILSMLTLGIGLLWLLPYIYVTLRIYYLSITGREEELN